MSRITLALWLERTYDEACRPTLNTARCWARGNQLDPPAIKEGRQYYVDPGARYTRTPRRKPTVAERLRAEAENSHAPGPAR